MKKPALDQATLKRLLNYDPETGVFTWMNRGDVRPQWNGRYAGKVAGYARVATGGGLYWSIRIFDWPFHAGPLAWLYMVGEWPLLIVDHRDGNGLNNRWANLRQATKAQNAWNSGTPRSNTTGFKGVSLHKPSGRFRATISIDGRQVHLGHYRSAADAHDAYLRADRERAGEFARHT